MCRIEYDKEKDTGQSTSRLCSIIYMLYIAMVFKPSLCHYVVDYNWDTKILIHKDCNIYVSKLLKKLFDQWYYVYHFEPYYYLLDREFLWTNACRRSIYQRTWNCAEPHYKKLKLQFKNKQWWQEKYLLIGSLFNFNWERI